MSADAGHLLLVLRHGATDWNAEKRMQGRADRPLGAAGRAAVAAWRLPPEADGAACFASPLCRARETAAILGLGAAVPVPALAEMDWGDWEGQRLGDLRQRLGGALARNEARGLDFRPPGGESPRQVQARLLPWLAARAAVPGTSLAVTHKGVIRALYALAVGWDMRKSPRDRLRADRAHRFRLDAEGRPSVERLNVALTGGADRPGGRH